jgi:hypothetical protein
MYSDTEGMWQFEFADAKQARSVRAKLMRRGLSASTVGRFVYCATPPRWSVVGVAPLHTFPPR